MRGLKAGLLMLGKTRAVDIIESIGVQLKRVMQPGGRALSLGSLDRLADSIVSLEYYMETLQSGRSDPWYMLDNAESSLKALAAEPTPAVPTVEPLAPGSPLRDLPNVVLSPHQAYNTPESLERMLDVVVANIENYLAGTPANLVGVPAS